MIFSIYVLPIIYSFIDFFTEKLGKREIKYLKAIWTVSLQLKLQICSKHANK